MQILNSSVIVRAALLSVACDIPAARKVSGFVGPQSLLGCSKCLLEFPTTAFGEKPTIIDPMHNLLLGTAKYILNVWKELDFLSSNIFGEIQQLVDSFISPSDIGRIPLKKASGFSDFTADQWRNWIVYYSLPSLKPYRAVQHYNVWLLFVKACHLFCRRTISKFDVEQADSLILQFCKSYVALYGKQYCTPNLHLQGHIASYGAFWLFSFERLNGILGSYHTNNNDVSLQLMRRFVSSHTYSTLNWPQEFKTDFIPVLSKCSHYCKGSLMQETLESCLEGMISARFLLCMK